MTNAIAYETIGNNAGKALRQAMDNLPTATMDRIASVDASTTTARIILGKCSYNLFSRYG